MAQSRLEKVGTVYSRMSTLLQTGALKNKPLWFDIYEAFPPKYEPRWDRTPDLENSIWKRKVLYEEDFIRAQFYKHFQEHIHETINLHAPDSKSVSQLFIEAYKATSGDLDHKSRFLAAVDALEVHQGINLRQPASKPESLSEMVPPERPQLSMKELFLQNKANTKD